MSNDSKMSPKRRKYNIESNRITPAENATVKSVMARLMGRAEQPPEPAKAEPSEGIAKETGSTILSATTNKTGISYSTSGTNKSDSTTKTSSTKSSSTTNRHGTTSRHVSSSNRLKTVSPQSQGVAPERDFQRIPNSVTREAMAARLFRGKSKQVWDYLWSVSRGAIVPVRTVRKSRPQIKAGAGLGSMGTVDAALNHLQTVGLIAVKTIIGENGGNEYEIFTPEEATASMFGAINLTGTTDQIGSTGTTQILVVPVLPESGSTSTTPSSNPAVGYEESKTFLKDQRTNDDDAALAGLVAALSKVTKETTGRELSPAESDRWRELAEVLAAELKIAAARTTVSSVPAFLAEHLRRRLWKIDKKQARAEGRELPDEAVSSTPREDVSGCPDCNGSGWWYPEGVDKGVAKCRHERLAQEGKGS